MQTKGNYAEPTYSQSSICQLSTPPAFVVTAPEDPLAKEATPESLEVLTGTVD